MDILTYLIEHISDIVALLAALGVTVEVTPIKVAPLGWLGNRINKDVNAKIDELQTEVNDIKYKNDMKDLADVRNRLISYGILIQKGEKLEPNVISSIQHDLDMYDYYKETYKYMEINGRKIKINGEIETTRRLVNEMILGGKN
jgi:hypothetical protein